MRRPARKFLWLSLPVLLLILWLGLRWVTKHKYESERSAWKTATVSRLAALSLTNEVIRTEIESIKSRSHADFDNGWIEDHVLLMTNGEFLVYAFRHGFNSGFVDHLFLAHASDGRWLYSTYHFCNQMAAIRNENPPASINAFEKAYSAREFDGKSDDCLTHTWPLEH
jgi:hypothetical protein